MFISLLLVLSISIFTVAFYQVNKLCVMNFSNQLNANIELVLNLLDKTYAGDWKVNENKLYKGNQLMNDNNEFVDMIKQETGEEVTIFLNDTRIATTVVDNGKKATGTEAAKEVTDTVLIGNKDYIGNAKVLNKPYEVKYVPIRDKEDKTVGMIFIGIEKSKINQQVMDILLTIGLIALGFIILSLLVGIKIIKNVTYPLETVVNYFGSIAQGNLCECLPKEYLKRCDEIGDLACASQEMQKSVKIINNTDNMNKELDEQVQIINENICIFKKIVQALDNIEPRIHSVSSSAININEEKSFILVKIESAASVSQETAATAEQIAAASQEMNASSEKVASSAEYLNSMTKEMIKEVNKFKI